MPIRDKVYDRLKSMGLKDSKEDFFKYYDSDEKVRKDVYNRLHKAGMRENEDEFYGLMSVEKTDDNAAFEANAERFRNGQPTEKVTTQSMIDAHPELGLQTKPDQSEAPKWNVPQYDWRTVQQKKFDELSNSTTATPVQDQYGNEYYPVKPREVAYDEAVRGLKDISERKAETKSRLQAISNDVSNELNRLQSQVEVSDLDKFRPANLQSMPVNPVNQELMPEYTALRKAQRLVEESNNIIEEASKKGNTNFMAGLARGFWDNLNAEDYTFGADDAAQSAFLYRALDKAEKGESLTKAEETLLDAASINMAVQSYYAQDLGKGYGAGQVTAESIPFMLEMAINPISASGKTTAKALLNYGLKKFAKNKAAKVGARLAGDALAATGMAATTGFGDVLEGATDRLAQNYNYQLDDEGRLHVEKKDDTMGMGEAFARSFATRAIENQSEMIFKAFEPIGGFMKGVQDILPGGVNKFFEMLGNNKVADAYRAIKNSPVFRNYLVKDIRNATQIGGLGEEYLEEVYNNIANAAIGEMKWEDVVSLDKNIDTLLGLAPTQVMFGLLGLGGAGAMRYQTRKTLEDLQATMNEQQRKDLEGLLDMGLDAKEVDVRGFIRNVMQNERYTIENKRDLIKAAYNVAKQNGIDELTEADTIDKVNAENALIDSVTDPSTGIYTEITATLPDAKEGTIEVPGYVVGWLGEGEKRQPIFVQEGMENTYENRRVLKPGQWSEEAVQQKPAEEVKALNEEMIREEAAKQAEQEAKYAPEVLNAQMQQGVPFDTPNAQIIPVAPMPEGNGWIVEEYALDTNNKVAKTPIVRELTNDEYRDMLQAQLNAEEAAQEQIATEEQADAPEVVEEVQPTEEADVKENLTTESRDNLSPVEEIAQPQAEVQTPVIPTKEDGSIDFVSYGKEGTFKTLGEKYGGKMPNKVAVTAKALAEDLKKAQNKLQKAEEAYDNAPIGREQKAEEARDKAKQELEAIQREANFWAEMDAEIKDAQARRESMLNPQAEMETSTEPMNVDEFVAQQLASGNIVLDKEDYKKETGYGDTEANSMNGGATKLFGKNGMTIQEAGERLMEIDRENGTNFFDQNDSNAGRDALISLLGSVKSRKELNQYIASNRSEQAKRESEGLRNELEKQAMEANYASLEDYVLQMEAAEMENPFLNDRADEIMAIFAEEAAKYEQSLNNTENGQGTENEVVEGNDSILPEEQLDNTGGTEVSEESERIGDGTSEESESTHAATEVELKQQEGETPLQFAERAAEENRRRPLRKRAEEWSKALGVDVIFVERLEDVTSQVAYFALMDGEKVSGWYEGMTGKVYFYMPNLDDISEVDKTYIHEVVAHKGLKEMLGKERFDELCDKVWDMMPSLEKAKFIRYPGVKGNTRAAADEYIAHLAEKENLSPEEKTIWDSIVKMFRELLDKALNGIISKSKLTDADIAELIKASYANLKSGAEGGERLSGAESGERFKVYKSKDGKETKYKQLSLFDERVDAVDDGYRPDNIQQEGDSTIERLNHFRELQEGEVCNVERKFTESKEFSFTRGEKVESTADVAYIFKSLEDEAVENSFVAITNGDNVSVFHLGMGAQTETVVDTSAILAAVDKLGADKVFFAHNHPSGMVKCSRQDILTYQKLKDRLGDKLQDGIIINTRSGKYGLFNSSGLVDDEGRIKEEKNEYPLKVYKFNKQSFNVDVIPTVEASSSGIAEFVSTQRLGKRDKVNALLLNNQFGCVGNILIDNSKNMSYVAERITNDAIAMGARQVVIYGRYPFVEVTDRKTNFASYLSSMINGFSQGNVNLIDIIQIDEPYSKSANDEGVRFRVVYHGSGAEFEKFDHVKMGTGAGSQVFGWGTYVTESEKIGRDYGDVALKSENRFTYVGDKNVNKWTIADAEQIMHTYGNYEEAMKRYGNATLAPGTALEQAVTFLKSTKKEDWQGNRHLYEVEIPDSKRGNYIVWGNNVTDAAAKKVFDGIYNRLSKTEEYDNLTAKKELRRELNDLKSGYGQGQSGIWKDLYGDVSYYLGSDKEASLFLNSLGYVGIKYPAGTIYQGDYGGASNYVIFNENDLKIVEHTRFRMTNAEKKALRDSEETKALFDYAKKRFGRTFDLREAGYVLPDGSMLDFSGRHEMKPGSDTSFLRGDRTVDHRYVKDLNYEPEDDGGEKTGFKTDMADFINRGAIRIDNKFGLINLSMKPTKDQKVILQRLIQKNDGDVYIDFADGWDAEHHAEYEGVRPMRIFSDIDKYYDEGIKPEGNIRFRVSNRNQEIFVSNAQKAVEGIKQEKATPQQWLAMIEKNSGLKAGEDKWLGLSDWLKGLDKKSVTKAEVLDFIGENKIQIEEVHYSGAGFNDEWYEDDVPSVVSEVLSAKETSTFAEKALSAFDFEYDDYRDKVDCSIIDEELAVELYNENNTYKIEFEEGEGLTSRERKTISYWMDEIVSDAMKVKKQGDNPINSTRLQYTTEGLENKAEIALTVPTIESWNESDEIHFGDAGEGRAVAWIRFGETTAPKADLENAAKEADDALTAYQNELAEKYLGDEGSGDPTEYLDMMSEDEGKHMRELSGKMFDTRETANANQERVLVIDEIQSKRHQEGRERGYRKDISKLNKDLEKAKTAYKKAEEAYKEYYDSLFTTYTIEQYFGLNDPEVRNRIDALAKDRDEKSAHIKSIEESLNKAKKYPWRGVPDAPFEKNWSELAFKRMLRYAAENGFDKVAWTTGAQQAERYNLGGVVSSIDYFLRGDGIYRVETYGNNGYQIDSIPTAFKDGQALADVFGKELATKMVKDLEEDRTKVEEAKKLKKELRAKMRGMDDTSAEYDALLEEFGMYDAIQSKADEGHTISGDGLRIGGEGMKGFYDKMLPSFVNKYVKKWGTKVQDIELPYVEEAGRIMHSVDVTEAMKESVMEGQVMFRISEKGKQIQAEVDKFTSKYNSKPIRIVEAEMDDKELMEALDNAFELEDVKSFMKESKTAAGYFHNIDKIIIFADRTKVERMEEYLFHENIHAAIHHDNFANLVAYFYEYAKDEAVFEKWSKLAHNKEYKQYNSSEEFLAYVVSNAMVARNLDDVAEYLGDKQKKALNKLFNVIGYDYDIRRRSDEQSVNGRTSEETSGESSLEGNESINTGEGRGTGKGTGKGKSGKVSATERKERLTGLFNKVADMGLEGVLENKDYRKLMVDIFKALPEEVRTDVADDAIRHYGGNIAPAVSDYIGAKADGSIIDKIVAIVREALRKIGFDLDLNANEVRYLAWRSKKPLDRNNLLELAEDIDMKNRLKVGEYDGSPTPDGGGTRFRVSGKLNVRDEYEATIKKGGFQAREAVQDAMLSLRRFQELIEKESGKKIRDFENAWMHENRLPSVVQAEIHDMERKFYKPMIDAVKKVMKVANLEQEQVADYLMLKHGIERNREMAVRKALTDDKGKIDRTRLEQWYQEKEAIRNDASLDTWKKKQEAMDIAALNYGADMSRDYSGLTSMFGTDDLADSTQQAYDEVEALETAHPAETESLGKAIKAMTQNTLDKSFESGLMDRKVYDELSKDMYDYYIPLRGFEETTSEEVYAYLDQDRGAFNAPLKRAKGRSSKSDNPIAYLKSIAESGIMQGNRNKMKQSFLNMVINHPSDLVSVREGVWVTYNPATGEWEVATPPAIPNDATPADVEAAMEAWEQQMEQAAQNDPTLVKKVAEAADVPYRVVGNKMGQHQIIVKRLGKSYTLTINGNPRLAMAINGQTNPNNTSNDGKVAAFVNNKIGSINRSLAAWYTTRNPDFVASNFMRDTFYTNTIVRAKEGNAYANKFHKNYATVLPKMLGLFRKYENGTLNPADQTEAAFLDFMMNGGETGYSNLKDLEHIKKQIAKELKGNRFAKVEALAEKLDILNRAVENTARFAAFLTSREEGRSIAKSVFDAKEISVNFNKKGAGGTFFGMTGQTWFGNLAAMIGASGRALYVFFNAAVQGTTNLMHVMKVNPKGTSAGIAAMFLMGAVVPMLFAGDDDDEKDYYDLPEHVRRNHLIIPGTGDAWISIPLPIEYRIMYGMGELLTSWRTGHERGSDIGRKMLNLTGQALPLNFLEEGFDAFIPSALSPIWQVYNNRSWTGLPIYKDNEFNKDDPEYTKAYKNVDRGIYEFTKALYNWSFDEKNQKERIDLNPAVIEALARGYFGGLATQLSNIGKAAEIVAGEREFDWRSIPIGNRLFKSGDERTKEKRVTNEYFENMEKLDFLQSRERMLKKTEKGVAVPELDKFKAQKDLETMQGTEVYKKYQEFKKQKKVVDKIRKTIKEKGSTPEREKQLMEAQEAANKSVR